MTLATDWAILFICGAFGAIIKDILKDNKISIPFVKGKQIYLGCVGGIIIGGFAGYFVDNDPVTAFLGGYAGSQIIQGLVISTAKTKAEKEKELKI
jgi:ABC-type xylose transport system permease subunit